MLLEVAWPPRPLLAVATKDRGPPSFVCASIRSEERKNREYERDTVIFNPLQKVYRSLFSRVIFLLNLDLG